MKSKTTAIWFVIAAALAVFIWVYETKFQPAPPARASLLPDLHAAAVTDIQIIPAGGREISVERTNGGWQLEKPLRYPAQSTAIENLLSALENLSPVTRLTAAEMQRHTNADAEFGFENPQFTLDLAAGEHTWHLRIGKKTAPGDGVYVRVVGSAGAFVTDTDWLHFLPHSADIWRSTALLSLNTAVNSIIITNGARTIELRCDPTNNLWRMTYPLKARADTARIVTALQALNSAQVTRFVTDDPKADLTTYGLQPAALDIWMGEGTNFVAAVHVGKDSPDHPGQVFAQRAAWPSVVTVASNTFTLWRGAVNNFRDTHLLDIPAPIAEIDVRGENNFTLRENGTNGWEVVGSKFPVDLDSVKSYVSLLANLRISEFVKDVVTGPDLQSFGFTTNSPQITLLGTAGDTNSVLASLTFGTIETNRVFVRCGGEDFIYAISRSDYDQLPQNGWEFRERHIWNFSITNVEEVVLHQGGKTRRMLRTGKDAWSLAPGSQGIINPPAIEETVHRLGQLTVHGWVGRNFPNPARFGLSTNNLDLVVKLHDGKKYTVDFGGNVPGTQTVFAAVTLNGDRWTFVFPPTLCPFVAQYLTIPQNNP